MQAKKILSPEQVETFRQDGVVFLPGLFEIEWLDLLARGIEADMANPGPRFEARASDGGEPSYFESFWMWSEIPEFRQFVFESPAAQIAAELLDAERINLVMDNWFRREAGTRSRPPWHHDIAYFDFDGSMCVLWLPLEATARQDGISFVRGSHLWGRLFQRVFFRDHSTSGEPGMVNGLRYEAPPDIDAKPEDYDLVGFDCAAGDCIMFDMRTLHGALADSLPGQTAQRFTLRMTAEDGRISYRGDWARNERAIFEARGYHDGDAIDGEFFPRLWPPASDYSSSA